ncbi:MAG: ECF transporter S component [Lachnospiraceae bacterium]|nr:ECF transporter S component [Lachnospiraceae bacterium]
MKKTETKKLETKKLVLSGVFLALGLVLPFLTMQMQSLGSMLLPMHLPVLLCGFICGAPYGLIVGFVTPLLRSVLFGMPKLLPMASAMAFELAAYGFLAGICYKMLAGKREVLRTYASLILSMLGGRLVWAVAAKIFYTMAGMGFTAEIFLAGAFLNAVPGIIIQLILIPVILLALKKAKYIE